MVFLMLAVLINCTLVFTLKVAHVRGWNAANVTMVNYGCAALLSLVSCAVQGLMPAFAQIARADLATVTTQPTVPGSIFWALVLGTGTGAVFVVNIILTNQNVIGNGAGISMLFSRSGFLISVTLSALIFGERLTAPRLLGAALTVLALAAAAGIGGGVRLVRPASLVGSLCCIGLVDMNNKLYSAWALPLYKANFTAVVFSVACLIYAVYYVRRRRRERAPAGPRRQEVAAGVVMGVPNAFGNIAQILALGTVPASALFPTIAAGSLLLSTVLSALVFREPFGKRQITAVLLTVAGLVLVNLPA